MQLGFRTRSAQALSRGKGVGDTSHDASELDRRCLGHLIIILDKVANSAIASIAYWVDGPPQSNPASIAS